MSKINNEFILENKQLRNKSVQTPGPPVFPIVPKFTPKERSAASEAQSRAAKEANRSKAWMKSRFSSAHVEFNTIKSHKFGMIAGPTERLTNDKKVHIALSSCLNGEAVRHNAGHCFAPFIVDDMGEFLTFESVCPEVEGLGLGTPRETIRLVNSSGDLEDWGQTSLQGTKSLNNYTSIMADYTASRLKNLDIAGINGYILKSLSPSCGLRGIPVYPSIDTKGRGSGKAQAGMFAKALMELWPELPVEDEGRLADVSLRHSFYTRVEAHRQWRRMLEKPNDKQPYLPLQTFHKNHLLLVDSHNPNSVKELQDLIDEAMRKNINITDKKCIEKLDDLYYRYYNTFFISLKRTGSRASTARCLRYCLSVLEGKDYNKEIAAENESETAAEGEARRNADLNNGTMLGILLDYDDENVTTKNKDKHEDKLCNAVKKEVNPIKEKSNDKIPFIQRCCVIDPEDSLEISESIKDYYNAQVPLSMPLNCFKRQLKRLKLEQKKHITIEKNLDCNMGRYPGSRALELLENQAFLQPHKCKRVLSTIRQNKFGQTFEPTHVFTCL